MCIHVSGRAPALRVTCRAVVDVYVSGASGFVGRHVVSALRDAGARVRDDFVELDDRAGLELAVAGCEAVVHVAALYSYDASLEELWAVNVEGTRNVLDACARAGVRRLVHTSTAGTCGPVPGRIAAEEHGPPDWELTVPYKRTKLEAERLVLAAAADGLDAVIVNPTTPVGEGDERPGPTGRMIRGVATGRYRGYLAGAGLNVVDVRDVGAGHALALERGHRGERYLLGGRDLDLRELFALVAAAAGRAAPRLRVPYAAVRLGAAFGAVNRHEALLARVPAYFSSAKAERELGYRSSPIEPAIARAVADLTRQEPEAAARGAVP
jgi:dihydroflavonol-4-reductase